MLKNYSQKVFCVLSCIFLFFSAQSLFSQSDLKNDANASAQSATSSGFDVSMDPSEIQFDSLNSSERSGVAQGYEKSPSTLWLLFKMIFALAVVAGAAYAVFYFMKKNMKDVNDSDPFLRRVSSLALGQGKSVQVVTLQNNAYLLGVTDSNINLLAQIQDEQLTNAMNLYADKNENVKKPRSFSEILEMFMPQSKEKVSENVYGQPAEDAADLIKKQRERLNTEESPE